MRSGSTIILLVKIFIWVAVLSLITSVAGNGNHGRPWLHGIPTPLPLQSKIRLTEDTHLYTFSLSSVESSTSASNESSKQPAECRRRPTLGIPICSCLLVSPLDDRDLIRPYTPISSRHDVGSFTLLVKRYPNGSMGAAFEKLNAGDKMLFWQISKNIKERYPFGNDTRSIIMLAAGTGITPMYQALRRLFDERTDEEEGIRTKVTLLYGSRTDGDILLKEELESMQRRHPDRLTIVHVLSRGGDEPPPPSDGIRAVRSGRIDKATIVDVCGDDISSLRVAADGGEGRGVVFWVCGPPSFYDDLCGPREDEEVGGVLGELGVSADCVVKF